MTQKTSDLLWFLNQAGLEAFNARNPVQSLQAGRYLSCYSSHASVLAKAQKENLYFEVAVKRWALVGHGMPLDALFISGTGEGRVGWSGG